MVGILLKAWEVFAFSSEPGKNHSCPEKHKLMEVISPSSSLLPSVSFCSSYVCFQILDKVQLPFKCSFYYFDDVHPFGILTFSHFEHSVAVYIFPAKQLC